jgi:antitoxin CptB
VSETPEARLKRVAMRSWRRGTKEMDLILGPYADAHLATMPTERLALYDALLGENDQDLYQWMTGAAPAPGRFASLVADISGFAQDRNRARS